uniref:(northern house mosquito) hypothetical protein n=1 Tax=Culex pipiens TaxID=7175 RepID=A0A8D8A922_CULPI
MRGRRRNVPDHCSRVTFRKFTLFCIVTLYLSLGFSPLTSLLRSIFHFSKQRNCFSFFFCEFSFSKIKFFSPSIPVKFWQQLENSAQSRGRRFSSLAEPRAG